MFHVKGSTSCFEKCRAGFLASATVACGILPYILMAADPKYAGVQSNPFGITSNTYAAPCFVDIDGDNDKDLFVGRKDGLIQFFRNAGTSTSPAFLAAVSNPFGITDVGTNATPDFADIDGDGDQDAFVGNGDNANTIFFLNSGNSSSPTFASAVNSPFGIVPFFFNNNAPDLTDIDGDGDIDFFFSDPAGATSFLRNSGNSTSPAFASIEFNPFGIVRVGGHPIFDHNYGASVFADMDEDGDVDALIGSDPDFGMLFFCKNRGNSANPTFDMPLINPFGIVAYEHRAHPDLVDIDGDGDLDLFVGTRTGMIRFFRNTVSAPDTTPPVSSASILLSQTNSTNLKVAFTSNDVGSGVWTTTLYVKRPGSTVFVYSGLLSIPGATGTFTYPAIDGNGVYEFFTSATDYADNVEAAPGGADDSIILDTIAPTSALFVDSQLVVGGNNTGTYSAGDGSGTGVTTVNLYHRKQGTATWTNAGPVTGGTWSHTPTDGSGIYYYQTVAIDAVGNSEVAPANGSIGDGSITYNSVANGPMSIQVATGSNSYVFPMETGHNVSISFTGVTAGGTVFVSRTPGDNAPAGHMASGLIDEMITISAPGLLFAEANVTVNYDESLLDGLPETDIATAYRDNAGAVTPYPAAVDTTLNTIAFTTTGFSDWYFGSNDAAVNDWAILEE